MLRDRILTALLLIPFAVGVILLLPTPWLASLFGVITLAAAWEWAALAGLQGIVERLLYTALFLPLLLISPETLVPSSLSGLLPALLSLFWLLVTVGLFAIRSPLSPDHGRSLLKIVAGFVILIPAWWSVIQLHGAGERGPLLLLFLMVLIWGADSGAYFSGKRWGRRKLAPLISPGKSVEGAAGAMVVALLCAAVMGRWLPEVSFPLGIVLCLTVTLISIVGDLFESLLKRQAGVKDSGKLLPGHGGVLDRIDSLIAAAPLYLCGLLLLEVVK